MKKLITLILLLLLFKTSFSQGISDNVTVKVNMGLYPCFAIKQVGNCLEIIGAPSIELFEFFYMECGDLEYKKFNGESSKFNEFLKTLCDKNKECSVKIIVREKILY